MDKVDKLETLEDFRKALVTICFSADILKQIADSDTQDDQLRDHITHFRTNIDQILADRELRNKQFHAAVTFLRQRGAHA